MFKKNLICALKETSLSYVGHNFWILQMNVLLCWLTQFLENMKKRKNPQTKKSYETYPKALNYTVGL